MAIVTLGHDASVRLNRGTKLFPVLACRVAGSAVPVRCPSNGLMIMTFDTLPMVAIRMLLVFKDDVRPCTPCEYNRLVRYRNLSLLARAVIRNTALKKQSEETTNKSYFQQESPHKILLLHNPDFRLGRGFGSQDIRTG